MSGISAIHHPLRDVQTGTREISVTIGTRWGQVSMSGWELGAGRSEMVDRSLEQGARSREQRAGSRERGEEKEVSRLRHQTVWNTARSN